MIFRMGMVCLLMINVCASLPRAYSLETSFTEAYPRLYRARDLGIHIGQYPTGPFNALTDVAGVKVGSHTIIQGESIRTGVTVILPHERNLFKEKVPAAVVVGNGFGKLVGISQVDELGELETPIVLTNTLSVFRAADGVLDFMLRLPGNEGVRSVNPVVAECNDGWLNDIRARAVQAKDVFAAIKNARSGPLDEGSVGAGTGMMALGWKGGIGTSSRRIESDGKPWTLGVLVLANYGGALRVDGVPISPQDCTFNHAIDDTQRPGSVIIVLATDAPLNASALRRIAHRSFAGISRTGSSLSHGSGDYAIAFSTRVLGSSEPFVWLNGETLNPFFKAAAEATEEAVYNALFRARTVRGHGGHEGKALPYELVLQCGTKAGKNWRFPVNKGS